MFDVISSKVPTLSKVISPRSLHWSDSGILSYASCYSSVTHSTVSFAFALSSLIDDDDYIPDYDLLLQGERNLVKAKNGVFNAVKIGNKWVSLDYFGPFAMPLAAVLNAKREKDLQNLASKIASAVIKNNRKIYGSKPFFTVLLFIIFLLNLYVFRIRIF